MKFINVYFSICLVACAHGSVDTFGQSEKGGSSSTSNVTAAAVSTSSTSSGQGGAVSTAAMSSTSAVMYFSTTSTGGAFDANQVEDDEGVTFAIDSDFWELIDSDSSGEQNIQEILPCFNGRGSMQISGTRFATDWGQVAVTFQVIFSACVFPNAVQAIDLTYDGELDAAGFIYSAEGGNYLDLNSRALNIRGNIFYTNGFDSHVDETCAVQIHDDFDESTNLGGLSGYLCNRSVYVQEIDLSQ